MSSNEQLGKLLANTLGTGPSAASLAAQRTRILQAASQPTGSRWPRLGRVPLAVASCAALALGIWAHAAFRSTSPAVLEARWNEAAIVGRTAFDVGQGAPRAIEFSDGSRVVLHQRTRAEVTDLAPKRAELRLHRGKLGVSVEPRTGAIWTIAAGPFAVRVVGTRFAVHLAPEPARLIVEVSEGRVLVSGGDLPAPGVALAAGQRLERRVLPQPELEAVLEPPDVEPRARAEGVSPAPSGRDSRSQTAPDWKAMAKQGKYREALELAEGAGFDVLLNQLSDGDLLTLANSARYSGNAERAGQALLKLRQRFPGRPAAVLAAFYLARLAQDRANDPKQAAIWLRTYLAESPSGDLAAGARVDLMDILLRMGDRSGAIAVAKDYLQHHPTGSHAAQARALIAQTKR